MKTIEPGIFQREYTDKKTGEKKLCGNVIIRYYDAAGKKVEESSRSTKLTRARKLRARRISEAQDGKLTGPQLKKIKYEDVRQMLLDHAEDNELRSIDTIQHRLKHLDPFFKNYPAAQMARLTKKYRRHRKRQKATNGTINRELALIKQMLRLAYFEELIPQLPKIDMLEEPPAREGFLRPNEFATLVDRMAERHPEHVGWLEVAYWTGWRWKKTVLTLRWTDVRDGWLYAPGLRTKNKNAVRQRLIGPLGDAVARQRGYVDEVQKRTGRICQAMFVYPDGRPIKDPIDAFKNAKKRAGLPDLIMHDFCRSIWQNGVNAGVPEKDLMDATGRKTRSIADRYNVTDESRLEAVQQRMADAYGKAQPDRKVSGMGEGRGK